MKPVLTGWLAVLAIAAAQPGVRARALEAYSGDDFWTLSPGGQAGLAAIAVIAVSLWFWMAARAANLAWKGTGRRPQAGTEALLLAGLFALIHTASPQLFYAYYQQIIPGLPSQWVISWPPFEVVTRGLAFTAEARLAEHLAAGVFWATILAAFWRRLSGAAQLGAAAGVIALPFALRAMV